MAKKLCKICGINEATIPDRNKPGRPIKEICSKCHSLRLAGDIKELLKLHKNKKLKNSKIGLK